jgi:predicted nucleic acid-binding Zn ribbon protein
MNMRIVPNLNEIKECPRCGSNTLSLYIHEDPSISDYKKCPACGEKIYTNETTCSAEQTTKERKKNMRVVPDLNKVKGCPNCQNNVLVIRVDDFYRPYLFCHDCHEEIYESEATCSAEKTVKEKEKENFIFEMREEISNLTWSISINDTHTRVLVENIQNILNRIIDYIEEN